MKKKLILVLGIQGSGKTYWSRNWAEEEPESRVRLNFDDIRKMLGKYWVPNRELLVKSIFYGALSEAMYSGYDIVIDNMSNLNPKHQEEYKKLVEEFNDEGEEWEYEIEYIQLNTPLETCLQRDSERDVPIGEEVIRNTYEKYRDILYSSSN